MFSYYPILLADMCLGRYPNPIAEAREITAVWHSVFVVIGCVIAFALR